jgi:tyrosyl-tRNA synthetase
MKIDTNKEKINRLLSNGVEEVLVKESLRKKLESGKQLRVKLGFDPTGPKIHIGRAIILRKLRDFQRLGHKIVFIVGDFTALIGDSSDKPNGRPMLSRAQIKENLKNYKEQVGKIFDVRKSEFVFNSKWLNKLNFKEIGELADIFTVQQMLARRNFKERWTEGKEIRIRELLYALMQGYDSVAVKADVEIGGCDQLFNLQAGRTIQKRYGQKEQDILTTQMLEGTDGREMSTSWGNVINIIDEPNDMFGKVMSLKDDLIQKYFELCTDLGEAEIRGVVKQSPRDAKLRLSFEIVKIYHGEKNAKKAQSEFIEVFSEKRTPKNIKVFSAGVSEIGLIDLLVRAGLASSKSEARRLIDQGGVRINNVVQENSSKLIKLEKEKILQVGKRNFLRISK